MIDYWHLGAGVLALAAAASIVRHDQKWSIASGVWLLTATLQLLLAFGVRP